MTARKKTRKRRRFGTIDQPSPDGRVRIRYRAHGERLTEWTLNFEDAERRLAAIETDLMRGEWKSPRDQDTTLEAIAETWLTTKKQTPSTIARDRNVLAQWWYPAIGSRAVASIKRTDLQAVIDRMVAAGRAPTTVRTNFGVIQAVLNFAIDERIIDRAPVKRIALPDLEPVEHATPSLDTLLALIDELPPRYKLLGWLLGICGMRWSEAIALRVGDIDTDANVIYMRATLVETGGRFHPGRGKTKGSAGRISLPAVVAQAYREHLLVTGTRRPDDLLFTAPRGGPVRASNFRQRTWKPAIERAAATGYTARELRQVASALMREAGAGEHEVSVRLRHTYEATTTDVYGGITAERHAAVDQALTARVLARKVKQGSDDTQTGSA
jgi:integrase